MSLGTNVIRRDSEEYANKFKSIATRSLGSKPPATVVECLHSTECFRCGQDVPQGCYGVVYGMIWTTFTCIKCACEGTTMMIRSFGEDLRTWTDWEVVCKDKLCEAWHLTRDIATDGEDYFELS